MPADRCVRPDGGAEHEQGERKGGRDGTDEPARPLEQSADADERRRGSADDRKEHKIESEPVEPRRIGQQGADRESQRKQPRTHLP